MAMAPKMSRLLQLSDEELVELYDAAAERVVVATGFFLDELVRRHSRRQADKMLASTRRIERLTWAIAVFTLVSVISALVAVVSGQ